MKKILLLFVSLCVMMVSFASNINMPSGTGTGEEITCDAIFYDKGGNNGNHGTNQASTMVLRPATPGMSVSVEFTMFDIAAGSTMTVYDGEDATALQVGLYDEFVSLSGITIVASAANPTGALTFVFASGADTPGDGWKANVTCRAPCQFFTIALDPTVINAEFEVEDDIPYINVCKGDSIDFGLVYDFQQNGMLYAQSPDNTDPIWRFGYFSPVTGDASMHFDEVKGWDFSVYAVDVNGCQSNMIKGRVRVADNPIGGTLPFREICQGEEYDIRAGSDAQAEIQIQPIENKIEATLSRGDTVFLPDGSNICYETELVYDIFGEGQTLQDIEDLVAVSLWMEHSYSGDLSIRLKCPNGQQAALKAYSSGTVSLGYSPTGAINVGCSSGGGGTHLGQAPDPGTSDPCYMEPGVAYKYTFTSDGTNCFGAGGPTASYSLGAPCPNSGTSLQASPDSLGDPGIYYGTYETLDNLVGCPLNGAWTLIICDHLYSDNGYVFGWEITLNEDIVPGNWEYEVEVDSIIWEGDGATSIAPLTGRICPVNYGMLDYTYTVVDEYGCQYMDTFDLSVVPAPTPDILAVGDTARICAGTDIVLNANFEAPSTSYLWNTGAEADEIIAFYEDYYSVSCFAYNEDSTLICKGYDTVYVKINEQPLPEFEADTTRGCIPLTINMSNLSTPQGGDVQYDWRLYGSNGNLMYHSTLVNPEFVILEADTFHVQLLVSTGLGCVDSIMKWNYIVSSPQPIVEFTANPEISLLNETGGVVTFVNYTDSTLFAQRPANSWYWDFGDGVVDSVSEDWSPNHTYATWGDYEVTLSVTTDAGCSGEIKHNIIIEEDLVFPNVITPNGDGINDVFAIVNFNPVIDPEDPDQHRQNTLIIHNRWGKKVYEAENYDTYIKDDQLFAGEKFFDGEGCADGQYYFTFTYKGYAKDIIHNGSIMIIRDAKK